MAQATNFVQTQASLFSITSALAELKNDDYIGTNGTSGGCDAFGANVILW